MALIVIGDDTPLDILNGNATGLIPRDFSVHPVGYLAAAPPMEIKLIDMEEWPDRIREKEQLKSRLSDIRATMGPGGGRIPSLNQNSKKYNGRWGFCWTHSVTMTHILLRAAMGLPYVKLSAFMVASILNNYQDKGGWAAKALEFIEKYGQCEDFFWPEDRVERSLYTDAMLKNAAMHKITASWADMNTPMYDRKFTAQQFGTLLLSNCPVSADYNFMAHSVTMMDLVDMDPRKKATDITRYGGKGINSWGDQFGDHGEFILSGNRYIPDGAVAPISAAA